MKAQKKLKPLKYRIYGIFDYQNDSLIYINLNKDDVDLEFALENYNKDRYEIISFDITII